MADITVTSPDGAIVASLRSEDNTTIGDLLDMIGVGILQKDGLLKANKGHVLEPGTYTWKTRETTPSQSEANESAKRHAEQTLESLVIKHRILDNRGRPKRTLSYVSKSHAFSSLITQDRIEFGTPFFFPLVDAVTSTAFQGVAPGNSKDENSIHHPYFLSEMKKLVDSAVRAGLKIRQQLFWTKSGHWLKLDDRYSAGVEPDFCTTDLATGEPFIASLDTVKIPRSKYSVTIAFEQKKSFVDTDQMEIVDYGERLLCLQRGREKVYTALFHCCLEEKVIRWAEVTERHGQFTTKISSPASLNPGGEGQRQLLTMLLKTSAEVGPAFPKLDQNAHGQNFHILFNVGEGATSTVYAARAGDQEGVVKVMKNGFERLAGHEHRILNHLAASHVPGLLSCTRISMGTLFFDKLLRPFTGTFSLDNVTFLLDCIKAANSAGVIHRDIRPENILEDSDGRLYIIDWGFALMNPGSVSKPTFFQGTFRYGSDTSVKAALQRLPHNYTMTDDLESFVKTVVAVNSGGRRIWRRVSEIEQGDFSGALKVWTEEREKGGNLLSSLFSAASEGNYEMLKKNLVY